MIEYRQKTIRIWWQIASDDARLLVDHMVEKTWILMREAVVVLLPDVRRQKKIQRRDWPSPRQFLDDLQPFGVLAEHRINDSYECLVAVEETVTAGQ